MCEKFKRVMCVSDLTITPWVVMVRQWRCFQIESTADGRRNPFLAASAIRTFTFHRSSRGNAFLHIRSVFHYFCGGNFVANYSIYFSLLCIILFTINNSIILIFCLILILCILRTYSYRFSLRQILIYTR